MMSSLLKDDRKRGFFVTGTDTGVGKTLVSVLLVVGLRGRGFSVGVMKPVATGAVWHENPSGERSLIAEDTQILHRAIEHSDPISLVTPSVFDLPASPHLAAAQSGKSVDPAGILDAFHRLIDRYPNVIIEGVGGLLVPLREDWWVADMAQCFQLPLLVVARAGLGTLNHTLLTLEAARSRGMDVAGVIFCQATPPGQPGETWDIIEQDNMATIQRLGSVEILGSIPYLPDLNEKEPMTAYEKVESYIYWDKVIPFFS